MDRIYGLNAGQDKLAMRQVNMNRLSLRFGMYGLLVVIVGLSSSSMFAQQQSGSPPSQDTGELPKLSINEFEPNAMLKVESTKLTSAKFPTIDVHTHFGFRMKGDSEALEKFVEVMNRHQIALCTSLDAPLGNEEDHCDFLWKKHKDRFLVFAHIDFRGQGKVDQPGTWAFNQPGFVRTCCEQLVKAKAKGICGLKFFKQFGLGYRNPDGSLTKIDDLRFDPIWETCAKLELPVIIHTGDPAAFFQPIDKHNERYEELSRHPDWSFHGKDFPSRSELLDARNRVVAKHSETLFIGAHLGGNSENLADVESWLNKYPNLYVEFASRIAELGRQPYTTRDFLLKHQDRVLFGTDGPWPELRLTYYWRFLETNDQHFPYSEKVPPPQGLWNIYGVSLPDDVLKKIYFENALRVIPNARSRFQAACEFLQKQSK